MKAKTLIFFFRKLHYMCLIGTEKLPRRNYSLWITAPLYKPKENPPHEKLYRWTIFSEKKQTHRNLCLRKFYSHFSEKIIRRYRKIILLLKKFPYLRLPSEKLTLLKIVPQKLSTCYIKLVLQKISFGMMTLVGKFVYTIIETYFLKKTTKNNKLPKIFIEYCIFFSFLIIFYLAIFSSGLQQLVSTLCQFLILSEKISSKGWDNHPIMSCYPVPIEQIYM